MSGNRSGSTAETIEAKSSLERDANSPSALAGVVAQAKLGFVNKILDCPRANGIPGPRPAQADWTDPRWRAAKGQSSPVIPFRKPGWMSAEDWDAFRKAASRGSSYSRLIQVRTKVAPTLMGLRAYLRHLQCERLNSEIDQIEVSRCMFAKPAPRVEEQVADDIVLRRGLGEQELRQHEWFRKAGWLPWAWTEQRGTNIVLLARHHKEYRAWDRANRSLAAGASKPRGCAM